MKRGQGFLFYCFSYFLLCETLRFNAQFSRASCPRRRCGVAYRYRYRSVRVGGVASGYARRREGLSWKKLFSSLNGRTG
jgi:hypothetical protein